jgi:hypothetical protein
VLPFVEFIHARFAIALIVFAAVLGLLGAFQLLTRRAAGGGFRAGYLLLWGLTLVQGVAGTGAYIGGARPREILHVVYGVFAVLFLPGVYFYAARRASDTEVTLLTLACWTVCIAYGRGIMTGT